MVFVFYVTRKKIKDLIKKYTVYFKVIIMPMFDPETKIIINPKYREIKAEFRGNEIVSFLHITKEDFQNRNLALECTHRSRLVLDIYIGFIYAYMNILFFANYLVNHIGISTNEFLFSIRPNLLSSFVSRCCYLLEVSCSIYFVVKKKKPGEREKSEGHLHNFLSHPHHDSSFDRLLPDILFEQNTPVRYQIHTMLHVNEDINHCFASQCRRIYLYMSQFTT